ncbi:MAG: extracellular solute-binding protein [Clostridia bacterium]|nr:extracellular solute-binding protein [Clostridia bacterium]
MKKTAKLISLLLACLMLAASLALFAACGGKYDEEITVYNWDDYIYSQRDLQNDFNEYYKAKTGKTIKVNYSTFDTNETMLAKVMNGDAVVDVIAPSEYAIEKLLQNDLLEKIDKSKVSTMSNVNESIYEVVRSVFGTFTTNGGETVDITEYFVPYMWGTLGILYNADVVTQADLDKGWGLLWNENGNEALNGKIFMKDSIRDSYCAAVMYLKEYDMLPDAHKNKSVQELMNTNDDAMLAAVEQLLTRQKTVLKGYEVDFGKQEMISEKGLVDLAWSGDALYAIEEAEATSSAPRLDYFVPDVGGNVWFDGWVVPKNAKNKEAANYFIAFLNEPEIAMSNMLEIGYTSAVDKTVLQSNQAALALLAEAEYDVDEFFTDARRYPEITENLGVMKDFGARNDVVVAMWERVVSSNTDLTTLWIIIGVVAALVIVGIVIFAVRRSKNRRVKR